MTAEIAILNRVAVTLAADSAMTVFGNAEPKVYNSIDKIFELSRHDPIGVMIYNTLDFMGVPLDVVIRDFRMSRHCVSRATVKDVANDFFEFLEREIGASEQAQSEHVYRLSITLLSSLYQLYQKKMTKVLQDHPDKPPTGFHPSVLMDEAANEMIRKFNKHKNSRILEDIDQDTISKKFSDAIDDAITDSRIPHLQRQHDSLHLIVTTFIRKEIMSPYSTGIVISGFGVDDKFPQVHPFEIDGFFLGKLKYSTTPPTIVDRDGQFAEILPFAQRDMADSFLSGIAPKIENEIPKFLRTILQSTGDSIIDDVIKRNGRKKRDLQAKLKKSIDLAIREFRGSAMKDEKDRYRDEILQMVRFMPKQELADFAEAMINITSLKRHVSSEQETVAGPIDVAVISKSEGFIWVKRKHYFDPSFNPRYFSQRFGFGIISPSEPRS